MIEEHNDTSNTDVSKKTKIQSKEKEISQIRYSTVELPSAGVMGYPASIGYRDILVRDEKIIASATERTFTKVINEVLQSLLEDRTFFQKLCIYDRDFLLLWIWANNYSTIKKIEARCPHCDTENKYDIDITTLDVDDIDESYEHPYEYELRNGEKIFLRLLTVEDEEVARLYASKHSNIAEEFVLLCCSIEFENKMMLSKKIEKIENTLLGKEMAYVRGFHQHYKFGIDDVVERACVSCGEVNKIAIPFQLDHFLPTLSDDFR